MKAYTIRLALALVLSIAGPVPALAQSGGDFELSWSTVDGGGRYSAGDPYWLGGTAGQPDANNDLSGGDFELIGGFWYIKAEYPTAADLVSFTAVGVGEGILLRWETASEVGLMGFNLYRGDDVGGEPVRLNEALIPGQAAVGAVGAAYSFLDGTAAPGAHYNYWLEDVAADGVAARHGPVPAVYRPPVYLPLVVR